MRSNILNLRIQYFQYIDLPNPYYPNSYAAKKKKKKKKIQKLYHFL